MKQKNKDYNLKQQHIFFDEIDLWNEPRNTIIPRLKEIKDTPDMTEFESGFLCGCLRKFKPKKILEVGIAAGGTTAIILQAMSQIHPDGFEMHSVDYSVRYARNHEYISGELGKDALDIICNSNINHKFHLGDVACSYIEKIGGNIDCLILDTVHILPGELLDYITLAPYLSKNAIIILHDISLCHLRQDFTVNVQNNYACTTLFSVLRGDKYINHDASRSSGYPNIGAVRLNSDNGGDISDIFLSLLIPWAFYPTDAQIVKYRKSINENYDKYLLDVFDMALSMNRKYVRYIEEDTQELIKKANTISSNLVTYRQKNSLPYDLIKPRSNVVLYGAGQCGKSIYSIIKESGYCNVVGWVDRNYKHLDKGVESPETLKKLRFDKILICVLSDNLVDDIKEYLSKNGIEDKKIVTINT